MGDNDRLLPYNEAAQLKILASKHSPFPKNSLFKSAINETRHKTQLGDNIRVAIKKSDGLFPNVKTEINPLSMYKAKGRGKNMGSIREKPVNTVWITPEMLPDPNEYTDVALGNRTLDANLRKGFLYLPTIVTKLKRFKDELAINPDTFETIENYLTPNEHEYLLTLQKNPVSMANLIQQVIRNGVISQQDIQALTHNTGNIGMALANIKAGAPKPQPIEPSPVPTLDPQPVPTPVPQPVPTPSTTDQMIEAMFKEGPILAVKDTQEAKDAANYFQGNEAKHPDFYPTLFSQKKYLPSGEYTRMKTVLGLNPFNELKNYMKEVSGVAKSKALIPTGGKKPTTINNIVDNYDKGVVKPTFIHLQSPISRKDGYPPK